MPLGFQSSARAAALTSILGALLSFASAPWAHADLDVELVRGGRYDGQLDPPDEVEVYRVRLNAGTRLRASVRPRAAGSRVAIRLLDADDEPIAEGRVVRRTNRLTYAIETSGVYTVEVTGEGATAVPYSLSVSWRSPRVRRGSPALVAGGAELGFDADAGATATVTATARRRSRVRPRVAALRNDDSGLMIAVPAPTRVSRRHRVRRLKLPEAGRWTAMIEDQAEEDEAGDVSVVVRVAQLARLRRPVDLAGVPSDDPGDPPGKVSVVIGTAGGSYSSRTLIAGGSLDLQGVSIEIPAGALLGPTAIILSFAQADDLTPPSPTLTAAGTAVFLGPTGTPQVPDLSVTLTYDAGVFTDGTSSLRVLQRDKFDVVSVVPSSQYTIDATNRRVVLKTPVRRTFQVFHDSAE